MIDEIKRNYNKEDLTKEVVQNIVGDLKSQGLLGEEIICKITWKKFNDDKDSWIHFMDVLNPSNKLTPIINPIDGEKLSVVFYSHDTGFNIDDLVVGEYEPETSWQYLEKLVKVDSETVRKLPKSTEIKDLYGNKFAEYLNDKFQDNKEIIPIIYERFEEIYMDKADKILEKIEDLEKQKEEVVLENKEKEKESKSLDKSINTRERKIKVLDNDLDELKDKISSLKNYFIPCINELQENSQDDIKLINADSLNDIIYIIQRLLYHYENEGLVYKYDIISKFYKAIAIDQIVLLSGPSGTGKSSLVNQIGKIINKFKVHHIAVQSSWTDVQDLLGFFNPIQRKYISTSFLDALVEAKYDPESIHIICLDEMNLAHIEYYFSSFLSVREKNVNERYLDLYSLRIYNEVKRELLELLGISEKELLEIDIYKINEKINSLKKGDRETARGNLELVLYYPAKFIIPKNVRFVGTLNMDETVKPLSPKIIDRSFIIELNHLDDYENIKSELEDQYIEGILDINIEQFMEYANDNIAVNENAKLMANEFIKITDRLSIIPNARLNGRGRKHIEKYINLEQAEDEVIFNQIVSSKILPRVQFNKSDELKLHAFQNFTSNLPEGDSKEKAKDMMSRKRTIQFWG
ncbi:MAG: AAA family ATPase [Terrisporobacter sp.]